MEYVFRVVVDIDLRSRTKAEVTPSAFEDVADGKEAERTVRIVEGESVLIEVEGGGVVTVGEHNPFGVARGAGGVDERGKFAGRFGAVIVNGIASVGLGFQKTREAVRFVAIKSNDICDRGYVGPLGGGGLELSFVTDENQFDGCVVRYISHLFRT